MTSTRGIHTSRFLFFGVTIAALVVVWYLLGIYSPVSASDYGPPVEVGKIEAPDLKESSGLAASECQDVLWTHNDAGNEPVIFAMNTQGKHLGVWRIQKARNVDWESIAGYRDKSGKCFLLIGDIGDNDAVRSELQIYRVPEPLITPDTVATTSTNAHPTDPPELMKFSYVDGKYNAETLLVHPATADVYIVTKEKMGPASVHRIRPAFGSDTPVKTEKVATVKVPSSPEGRLTGGSFSPDGRRLMLCDLRGGYEFVLPETITDPDAIWTQKPVTVNIGDRKQGEGVSYARDGISLFASSEKKNSALYRIERTRKD